MKKAAEEKWEADSAERAAEEVATKLFNARLEETKAKLRPEIMGAGWQERMPLGPLKGGNNLVLEQERMPLGPLLPLVQCQWE